MSKDEIIWSFDLGKASIGEAVRRGNEFLHKASLLIPAEFAETKSAANRRRMWRTRQAHKAREEWLREVFRSVDLPVLYGRNYDATTGKWKPGSPGDQRLEREFPSKGDATCFTSCLLRIKLLRGEKIEPWQVYKAFHSAIQRRGYDSDIPWKTRETRKAKSNEEDNEASNVQRIKDFEEALQTMAPNSPEFHFPAYFDAWKMGLWDPQKPNEFKIQVNCHAQSTRNQIIPRSLVENEIRAMVEGASRHYPSLAGKANYLLYGPSEKPYASLDSLLRKKHGLREGGITDWKGVVGQKIPRFENRIIGKCVLIPRLNVCKLREGEKGRPHPQSLLAVEVSFLMKLKNLRIQRSNGQVGLTPSELRSLFDNPNRKGWAITKTAWKKICKSIGALPLPGHEEVDPPRFSGRSRFSRPALDILKRLILSNQKPSEFLSEETARLNGNNDPKKGLVESDLNFLREIAARNDTWDGLYIPNQRLEFLAKSSRNSDEAIRNLIGEQNDPIVRHRLSVFADRLKSLGKLGRPNFVVLEFVREDFLGKKAKLQYSSFIRKRAEERKNAREEAARSGATEKSAGLKLELLRAQDGRCLYTDQGLVPSRLNEYQIEHIVPRSRGGPDAVFNLVLTTRKANDEKGERTPFEWLSPTAGWDSYVNRVRNRFLALGNKKVRLLISANADELAEKYTALAETSWIAKLAQTIVSIHFGWKNGTDEKGIKRVKIVSGGLTGRIRRKYGLNRILNPQAKDEEEAEKKNRHDKRHHALDAMVISFIPSWARDAKKESFFRFPEAIFKNAKGFFEKEIANVIPQNLCFEKPTLAETIYGSRGSETTQIIVQRVPLESLARKPIGPGKTIFNLDYLRDQIKSVRDGGIRQKLEAIHANSPNEPQWEKICQDFHLTRKDGAHGSAVRRVSMNVGTPTEYKDLSKDGTGAFRKALKGHRGQIIYYETITSKKGRKKESVQVRPIYAFESPENVLKELKNGPWKDFRFVGFFRSGCLIEVTSPVPHPKNPLPQGKYILNTIITDSKNAKLTTIEGRTYPDIPLYSLNRLITSGMKRLD